MCAKLWPRVTQYPLGPQGKYEVNSAHPNPDDSVLWRFFDRWTLNLIDTTRLFLRVLSSIRLAVVSIYPIEMLRFSYWTERRIQTWKEGYVFGLCRKSSVVCYPHWQPSFSFLAANRNYFFSHQYLQIMIPKKVPL